MRIAITGSGGFIGSELVSYFLSKGDEVLLLQRKLPSAIPPGAKYLHYDLLDTSCIYDLGGIDALVHAAYIPFKAKTGFAKANVDGTMHLYNLCQQNDVQFVFLSSMSARADALSEYGRQKFELESLLDDEKCLILRPGLVIGKQGLFSRIRSSVQKTSIAFLVGGGQQPVQTIFVGDICRVIEKCVRAKLTGTYNLASPRVYSMKELFQTIAKKEGKKLLFIPVPYWMAGAGISLVENLRLPFPVSRENLLGLKQLKACDTSGDLKKLGIELQDINSGTGAG